MATPRKCSGGKQRPGGRTDRRTKAGALRTTRQKSASSRRKK